MSSDADFSSDRIRSRWMIVRPPSRGENVQVQRYHSDRAMCARLRGKGMLSYGLSGYLFGAGKSTIASVVEQPLTEREHLLLRLNGDNLRHLDLKVTDRVLISRFVC